MALMAIMPTIFLRMENESLYATLKKVTAGRSSREAAARVFDGNTQKIQELIRLVFDTDDPVSVKASWVLDLVASADIKVLQPNLEYFAGNLDKVRDESAIRPLARICEKLLTVLDNGQYPEADLTLTDAQHHLILAAAFKWLIGPHKVATKVFAMRCLYFLGKKTPWVHEELQEILKEQYARESSGYKARARDTLQKLEAYKRTPDV